MLHFPFIYHYARYPTNDCTSAVFASWWIRKKMIVATREIKAERGLAHGEDEEYEMLTPPAHADDTSYLGVESTAPGTYTAGTAR